jgi:signal transduction histidine kinase
LDLLAVGNSLIKSQSKNIELKLQPYNIDEEFIIKTDQLRIYQILLNLLSNAIKFTEEGTIIINYNILNATTLEISVKDTGQGISESDLEIIFDRFRQIDESTIKKHGGTGLGLSITKSLVELMNGRIEVNTKPGMGAEFKVILPCLIPNNIA